MAAKNAVISGDYLHGFVSTFFDEISISIMFKSYAINRNTISSYEVVDHSSKKSAASAVGRGLVGGLLLGPVGLLAGISAKSIGTHLIAIQFKDGKKSLLEVDDKVYKAILKALF